MNHTHSLSHTKWNCKYHVVFAPKYRRKVFYKSKRLEIPPKLSVSSFMGFLKVKSSIMIYERWGSLKYKYRNRQFWRRGYYVDTAGKNAKKIQEYIQNQLKEDEMNEQLVMGNFDSFKG